METVISALIVIALLVLTVMGLAQASLSAQATIAQSSSAMQERIGEQARTGITPLSAQAAPLGAPGTTVQLTLKNSGSLKLSDFSKWDVILQYSDGASNQVKWFPGSDSWSSAIYLSAATLTPEVYEPGILNPSEEMIATLTVSPAVGVGTTNLAVISTPNGIVATTVFTH
ncbi:MAG: hypothetical protein HZB51_28460 [Chloroflexi bacterium]|nr:hypothetical protein [Chloroflexota bacterium]